jgi:predicted AAA+ superfamily ATPase
VGILELDPLTAREVQAGVPRLSWQQVWLQGGFPDAVRGAFREWWENYLRTYIERDLPHLGVSADPLLLRRILMMLAHAQGGLFNASQFGNALGISYHTVQRYIDILEQTFLVRRLPSYFRNVGKRLTKAPKVYLRDTGLLHHLLNINSHADLESHPIRGASWETLVLEDLIRRERLRFPHTQPYFWRTQAGAEVDLVLDRGSERVAIEIKVGRGDKVRTVRALEQAAHDIGTGTAWILDQGDGNEPLRPRLQRRGWVDSLEWLPPEAT